MEVTNYGSIQRSAAPFPVASKSSKVSVDAILNFIGYGPLQVVAFCLVGLTALALNVDSFIFGYIELPIQEKWNLTSFEYSVLPAATGGANLIGAIAYSILVDRFGRVWPYALAVTQAAVFSLASAFSPNFAVLIVLRFGASVGLTGANSSIQPTLIEFLPVKNRGKMMVSVLVIQAIGICLLGGLGWWLLPRYLVDGWRYVIIATSLPLFVAAAYRVLFLFQSPRFLIAKRRYKEARVVFARMARFNRKNLSDFLPENVAFEDLVEIPLQRESSCLKSLLPFFVLYKRPYLRSTLLLMVLMVTSTSSFYGMSMFLPAALDNLRLEPYFIAFVGYCGQIPGILLMAIIVEWRGVGRINSIRFFTFIAIVSFLLFAFVQNEVSIPVIVILIYFSLFPTLAVLHTYVSEIYPTEIRSFSIGYLVVYTDIFGIIIPLIGGYVVEVNINWLFPVVWAGILTIQFLVSLLLNRETLNRNLTDTT